MTFVKPEDVLDAAKGMLDRGLVSGTAGNVSGRIDENRVCLTPSSVSYETMTLDDLVITDLGGNVLEGSRGPTSEKIGFSVPGIRDLYRMSLRERVMRGERRSSFRFPPSLLPMARRAWVSARRSLR